MIKDKNNKWFDKRSKIQVIKFFMYQAIASNKLRIKDYDLGINISEGNDRVWR
jgi:hypothetical protein